MSTTCTCDGRSAVIDRYAAALEAEKESKRRLSAMFSEIAADCRRLREHAETLADRIAEQADRIAEGLEQRETELDEMRRADLRGQIAGLRAAANMIGGEGQ